MQHSCAKILSVGMGVPDNVVTNRDITRFVDTTEDWIVSRTGIRQRHISPKENPVTAAQLGATAALSAMEKAGITAAEVDGIICATFTPDFFFPSTACKIQEILGCETAFAFDVSAACAGFVYGLTVANSLILTGQCKTVLLIGAEVISKTLDWTDRSTCILFGDGAGAVVLQGSDKQDSGVLASSIRSIASLGGILYLPAWGDDRTMKMKGNEVFKHAIRLMGEESNRVLEKAHIKMSDVDLVIPHQANIRIINGLAEHMGVSRDKVVSNIENYGNTSAASIPLALTHAWDTGRIKPGTLVLFTALGGGITVGSALVRF